MTKWVPMPLRQPGSAWPGCDTKGGKLDNGTGQLTQNSVNVQINEVDTLSKRLGFIRGQNERFGTVVCGLHTYVDNCGVEWLLVASDEGISIRQPFVIPTFTTDDSYPSDAFDDVAGLSTFDWRNTDLYIATGGSLQRGVPGTTIPFPATDYLRWFKGASSLAYEVQVEYQFDTSLDDEQVVSLTIKGNGTLTSGRRLQADLRFARTGTYEARLYKVDVSGNRTELATIAVAGSLLLGGGFFTLRYDRIFTGSLAQFVPSVQVVPLGGAAQEAAGASLNDLEDSELGQVSGIGCGALAAILAVTGGPR